MPFQKAPPLPVSFRQREVLKKIIRRSTSIQQHVTRSKIILLAADGFGNQQIAERVTIDRKQVYHWRSRWLSAQEILSTVEVEDDEKQLYKTILNILSDQPRSGAPLTYSAEVVCQIIAVACEHPQDCGHPISHWTPAALRLEVIKRDIVEDISVRQIGRFLKRGRSETPSGALLGEPTTP